VIRRSRIRRGFATKFVPGTNDLKCTRYKKVENNSAEVEKKPLD